MILEKGTENPPKLLIAFVVVVYLMFGTIVYHLWEDGWSVVNAFYWSFITLSTIGFGDYAPGIDSIQTTGGKLRLVLGAFYIVVGLAVLAMGMDLISAKLEGKDAEEEDNDDPMLDEEGNIRDDLPPDTKLSVASIA